MTNYTTLETTSGGMMLEEKGFSDNEGKFDNHQFLFSNHRSGDYVHPLFRSNNIRINDTQENKPILQNQILFFKKNLVENNPQPFYQSPHKENRIVIPEETDEDAISITTLHWYNFYLLLKILPKRRE